MSRRHILYSPSVSDGHNPVSRETKSILASTRRRSVEKSSIYLRYSSVHSASIINKVAVRELYYLSGV